jgi:hypothetical protein
MIARPLVLFEKAISFPLQMLEAKDLQNLNQKN